MAFADGYIHKKNIKAELREVIPFNLAFSVIIPVLNEPDIITTLNSLYNCENTGRVGEVILVINSSENCEREILDQNKNTLIGAKKWILEHPSKYLRFHVIHKPGLPEKFAGVGLARKIGMDEAVLRFNRIDNANGIIINFDADSTCDPNYFSEIISHFEKHPKTKGISIYFEHPIKGDIYSAKYYQAIWLYELHLRYYKQALQYTGFPYFYYTVGSAFAVNAAEYVKQGGMNRQKAGEDFYFLQKIIPLGNYYELNTTRVIPSPRISDRVPFGTGAAMTKMLDMETPFFDTYNFKSFKDLESFIRIIDDLYTLDDAEIIQNVNNLPESIKNYLLKNSVFKEIERAKKNSATKKSFKNQFYGWFNAFRVMRFLNTSHIDHYLKSDIRNEAGLLLDALNISNNDLNLLEIYRKLDRGEIKMTV